MKLKSATWASQVWRRTKRNRTRSAAVSCRRRRHQLAISLSLTGESVEEESRRRRSAMAGSDPRLAHPGLAIVIMGVSGCGKSTVAALLAEALGCSFIEADDYHSQANKAKMSKGIPLSDADRTPWLESLRDAISDRLDHGEDVAVSCSALQLKYREVLRAADRSYKPGHYADCRVKFVCLKASVEVITERMQRRSSEGKHFMPASLLQSQVDLLQINAAEGITEVDATEHPGDIVRDAIAQFREELASTDPPCF
ncbi:hypothetical protein SETIT_4G011500v2 [Setaria italica]|uniref:Gluconokinase n=2 Tax=Setaria italica TaxID=4555 RepID=A0A368QRJ0_SETIT|nr:probable gluconokinase [Setaria italica]RCV19880.1 hypothetical protein SETIT_4G011500v2 [Setaria italica]